MQIARRAVIAAVSLLIGIYYLWSVRAAGHDFIWGHDLGGYYNYLGRAFAHGHLYVEIKPSPQLLALPDPYAASVDDSLKMHDMALYGGRYYLYHGAAPAVLLFTPWRLVTGHDLPENFGLALFCFAGFVFSAATLLRLLALAKARPGPFLLVVMLLAIGVCQSVPYLLSRVWVYEVAIGGGYCCLSAALFFLVRSLQSARGGWWLAASGLMFGLSIGCRPHLGLAAIIATAALCIYFARLRRLPAIVPFFVPLVSIGLAIAAYNHLRFGNPFEFGVRYLLGNPTLNRTELAGRYVLPGLYYMLFCAPDFSAVFPWVRLAFRYPFHVPGYFLEPTAGAIFLAPFLVGLALIPVARGVRVLVGLVVGCAVAILLFITGTGFTSQRYEVDFLPLAVLAATSGFAIRISRSHGWKRRALAVAMTLAVACGVVANMALGLAGPYDDLLKNRPASYARIARWFSPIERFRPLLNPRVDVEFTVESKPQDDGLREPLLSMGHQTFRYIVLMEHHPGRTRLISHSERSSVAREVDHPATTRMRFHVTYSPESRKVAVAVDGQEVLVHDLGMLLTAPSQVTVGENRIAPDVSCERFDGRIDAIRVRIAATP